MLNLISVFAVQTIGHAVRTTYLDCQINRYSAGEGTKAGHSLIIEAKDFIRHNTSIEAAKKRGRLWAQYLAELELIWELKEAEPEDVVDL